MSKKHPVIEINGRRYNAQTGHAMDVFTPKGHTPKKTVVSRAATPKPVTHKPATHKPRPHATVHRHAAGHLTPHAPKAPQTLMRHAVHKPGGTSRLKAYGPVDGLTAQPVAKLAEAPAAKRAQHAKHVPQSQLIKHFNHQTPTAAETWAAPIVQTEKPHVVAPVQIADHTTNSLLETALRNATSHQQPAPKVKRRKHFGTATATVAVLAVIGLGVSQQLPNLKLHLASNKAGFSASLPGYKPAGYSLGHVASTSGQVASQFHSNSDDQRSYSLVQRASDWDSQSLRDNFVKTTDVHYQTATAAGRTVYIYGNGNATWVNGGIWYTIQSNGSLSNQQLLHLASSL